MFIYKHNTGRLFVYFLNITGVVLMVSEMGRVISEGNGSLQ